MPRLIGKNALVTGASRGIGKAIALRLAEEGCTVVVHYHDNPSEAQAVADIIQSKGGTVHLLQADFMSTEQVIRLGEQAWEVTGGLDILINNVGISYKRHFLDLTEVDFDAFNTINFKSTTFLTQTVARKMVERDQEGSIYTITSVNGTRPNFGQSAYGASKYALESLMRGVALELAVHNIRVNTFALGAIESDMTAPAMADPIFFQEAKDGIPMGRFGLPEEVAAVMVDLLVSGSYLTGTTITLDGGLLLMRGYGKSEPYKKL